jgi:hypothetical protein
MARKHALWIGLAVLLGGCSIAADTKLADKTASDFYAQVAAKQYAAIYQAAAPEFRGAMTSDTFVGMMTRIDRRMGACQTPKKAVNWRFNATQAGDFQTQAYIRACANGPLNETVTVVVRGGKAPLAGYQASSPLLLTD